MPSIVRSTISYTFEVKAFLFAFFAGFLFFLFEDSIWSTFAVIVTIYVLLSFLHSLGNSIPIAGLMVLVCSLQWLLGPVLCYAGFSNHYKYYMYVSQIDYLSLALLGIIAFAWGLSISRNKREQEFKSHYLPKIANHLKGHTNLAYRLIVFGWACSLLQRFMPGGVKFIFYLFSNIMYIGVIYLLFQPSKNKWWIMGAVLFLLFLSSLQSAMFHNLLLWVAFIGLYALVIKNYSFQRKLLLFALGFMFIYLIQIAKWEIRRGQVAGNLSGFFTVVNDQVLGEDELDATENPLEDFVIRLNQGWIISRIMYYIPAEAPFVEGETVMDAVSSSLLPRFINPGKTFVGGKEYFQRFTGFNLQSSTSMGASLIGEGYANFGTTGAIVFMFIIGLFYRFVMNIIYKVADKYPTIILWLPLIFLQVVKAESDLVRVLNHLVKASLMVFLIYWVCYKVLKWRI